MDGWVGACVLACVRASVRAPAHANTGTVITHSKLEVHHEGNDLDETKLTDKEKPVRNSTMT